jgi:hypothetical protein
MLRLYVERMLQARYQGSCIFHGRQGGTLDRCGPMCATATSATG